MPLSQPDYIEAMYGLSSRVFTCQKAWQAPPPARTARLILYARPPQRTSSGRLGTPVAAHCVRPLRSARLIIRIIRHDRSVTDLAKRASPAPARLPSLSLLHNKIM